MTPKQQGHDAFHAGKRLEENPFEVDSDAAYDWIDGRSEAEAEDSEGAARLSA